jgi:hypothetical protein
VLSGEQIGSDVGAGLPGPIGEGLAVLEEGLAAPGLGDSEGNRARPTHKGLTKGSRGFADSPGNMPASTWPSCLFSRWVTKNVTAPR